MILSNSYNRSQTSKIMSASLIKHRTSKWLNLHMFCMQIITAYHKIMQSIFIIRMPNTVLLMYYSMTFSL